MSSFLQFRCSTSGFFDVRHHNDTHVVIIERVILTVLFLQCSEAIKQIT